MRRVVAVALAVGLVIPVGGVATAHGNDIEADSQISADGTVLVENVLLVVDGFVVVHRDGGDGPGEAIGHTDLSSDSGTSRSVRVQIDDAAWSDWGDSRTVWVVIHRDEGDRGFDPDEDPMERSFGFVTAERIQLGKDAAESSVVAADFSIQRTETDAVTVRRVALGRDGAVAIRRETADGDGRVLGVTVLDGGVHENVSVGIDGSVFASHGRRLDLVAELYDGDGPTDGASPFRVGGTSISTEFTVERTGPLDTSETKASSTTVAGRARTTTARPPEIEPETTTASMAAPGETADEAKTGDGIGASGPGLEVVAAVVALLLTVGTLRFARRREL